MRTLTSPQLFGISLLVFAFLPGLLLRLLVCLYPKDHPRRTELLGQLYSMPQVRRPWFVVEQLETALTEGLLVRARQGLRRARSRRQRRDEPDKHDVVADEVRQAAVTPAAPLIRVFSFPDVLHAAGNGEHWALTELFRAYQPPLLRYLRDQEPDAADDLAEKVWIAAATQLVRFHGDESAFRTWLFTLGRVRVTEHRRRAARRRHR